MTLSRMSAPTLCTRASGILLHPASLPNAFLIGDMGPSAMRFVDFLAAAGQRWWQMLPVGPTGPGHSPYQATSAFAGNPLLISLETLADHGWLSPSDLSHPPATLRGDRIVYEEAAAFKDPLLRKAFRAFDTRASREHRRAFRLFCHLQKGWLEDYALYTAIASHSNELDWTRWAPELRRRERSTMAAAKRQLSSELNYQRFLQWQFVSQWQKLRRYAAQRGIGFIGDVPIFVAPHSADVWAHPELFQLRADGSPRVVAGVPPDYFSRTGQRWGNPHYRWDVLRRQKYRWWVERFRMTLQYFDAVRLDHFIGFVRYYEVPGDAPTAEKGRYRSGPGKDFFKSLFKQLRVRDVPFIAEDLGVVTPEVKALRDTFGLPGMRVLQFAFGRDPEAKNYLPHSYIQNCVAYTGTHDNDTTVGWFKDKASASSTRSMKEIKEEQAFTLRYLKSDGREIHWDMIRAAVSSVANTAIVPMQDVLGLGSDARMNRPGTAEGNWDWRLKKDQIDKTAARRLREMAETYGRI
jgi:4-alpha-glucanotransferase